MAVMTKNRRFQTKYAKRRCLTKTSNKDPEQNAQTKDTESQTKDSQTKIINEKAKQRSTAKVYHLTYLGPRSGNTFDAMLLGKLCMPQPPAYTSCQSASLTMGEMCRISHTSNVCLFVHDDAYFQVISLTCQVSMS